MEVDAPIDEQAAMEADVDNSKRKRAPEEAEPPSNEDGPLPPSERAQAEHAEAKPAPARVPRTSSSTSSSSSSSSSTSKRRSKSGPSGERLEGATGGKGLGEPNPGSPEGMTYPQPGKGPGAVLRGDPAWKSRTEPTAPAGASPTPSREDPYDTDELTQPSQQHDSQPARSKKRSLLPYTPRELWGKKLNKDYDEYKKASPERRKELWLSWTSLERRRVFCTASSQIREEQRAWKAELSTGGGGQSSKKPKVVKKKGKPHPANDDKNGEHKKDKKG